MLSKIYVTVGGKKLQKDDVHSIGKEDGSYTWSAASKEVEELMRSDEKKSCSSSHSSYLKLNKSSKGTVSCLKGNS